MKPELIKFSDERWLYKAREIEHVEYFGESAIKIKGGAATLPSLSIQNGLVEFDIAVTEERGFAGVRFRVSDNKKYEHFYIRPHQSGKPDANQYNPVYNGIASWQLYHGKEFSVQYDYPVNKWIHIKVIFAGADAEIYIDSDKPVLHLKNLRHGVFSGGVGLDSSPFSAVHFANFKVTSLPDTYSLPSSSSLQDEKAYRAPKGIILDWEVSDAFNSKTLKGIARLDASQLSQRTWTKLKSEETGITNLAIIQGKSREKNTAFARFTIHSDKDQIKALSFGYSDKVSLFVNDQLMYSGDTTYQSRDFRYLGTMGLFDRIPLALKKGKNEITFAVSERFGGWGVLAKIEPL